MYVIEHLDKATKPLFSYEIIPPPRGRSARDVLDVVEQVLPFDPPFIDVTSHSAEAYYEEFEDGTIKRRVRKKRTGTISICGIIQNRYNIDTVPHLLCRGFTREETEDAMIELSYLGIHNVLAIRGDQTNYVRPVGNDFSANVYAEDLVRQLVDLKSGKYLEEIDNSDSIDMCIGVGAYPEKHLEAPNMKQDVAYLKAKADAGADYIVTQMVFDNTKFFELVKQCRAIGIEVPIIPGLKVLTSAIHLSSLPKNFHISIPEELADEVQQNRKHAREIGIRWAVSQCKQLLNESGGVPCLHFYVMNDATPVLDVIRQLS
ncbi:MAG: methylenetetrahydrofolate reductase [Candidatus Zixiibacteriota bacterium]